MGLRPGFVFWAGLPLRIHIIYIPVYLPAPVIKAGRYLHYYYFAMIPGLRDYV